MYRQLLNIEFWQNTLNELKERNPRQRSKIKAYQEIIDSGKYNDIAKEIISRSYKFSIPKKVTINKIDTNKKKDVYLFDFQDDFVLKNVNKIITQKYAHLISASCHSFQKGKGAKSAFRNLLKDKKLNAKYCLKTDISNYFNSIDIDIFFKQLPSEIINDKTTVYILKSILYNDYILSGNTIVKERKGLMAGSPLAPFLSNFYLKDIDEYFENQNVTYARYSDDLIIFDEKEKINEHFAYLEKRLGEKKLKINESKTKIFSPGEKWHFLGFAYENGIIDISDIAFDKLKRKIKRLSKRYHKKFVNKKFTKNQTLTYFINKINKKFYGKNNDVNDLCWTRWFFPLINTHRTLKRIDKYVQDKLRYSVCGRYSKLNYKKVTYTLLKTLDYKPLTSSYFLFKFDYEKFNKLFKIDNNSLQH